MDSNVKLEQIDISNVEIKEEKELLIESESQWFPTKFEDEENEYYQEFKEECSQTLVKNEDNYEQFTIEYLDESEGSGSEVGDYENGEYEENEAYASNMKHDSDDSDLSLDDGEHAKCDIEDVENRDESSNTKFLCKLELNKWINNKYIKRRCPVCNDILPNYCVWQRHIELFHHDSIQESQANYYFSTDNGGVCKKCNKEYRAQFPRYVHSLRHTTDAAVLDTCICKVCNFSSSKCFCVQKHIVANHPEVVKEFKVKGFFLKCPLCSNTYKQKNHFSYHFLDKHPEEYKSKFYYYCHFCEHQQFSDEEIYLKHLIEKHDLNSWEKLNYRKIFEDKMYISCVKCNRLFFKNDTLKLLKHYFKHENDYYWSCKFCCKKTGFKGSAVSHMCNKMVRYYEKRSNMVKVDKIVENSGKAEWKIENLQQFEKYIAHICPFCNKLFDKMIKWQHHLRTVHKIDTLKGLEMKVISSDSNKLICVICHTMVANSPEQLHAHRFQHLPYKPYKCLHCSVTLDSFRMAFNHAFKRCKDEEDRDNAKNVSVQKFYKDIRSMVAIQCSICDFQKFPDILTVLKHYKDEHSNFEEFFVKHQDNSMICKVCRNKYVQRAKKSCFEHLHLHFDEKTFICTLCSRSYPSFRSCYQHLLTLHYVKPLNSQAKEKNMHKTTFFLDEEYKVSHVTLLPQLGKPTFKSHVLNEFVEFISYACPECNEGMATQQNWHIHITTKHNFFNESNLYFKDSEGSLKCPTCNMTLVTSITQQQKHKLTHMPYRSFICNLCYARFNSLGVLYGHLRRIHFAKGSYACPICHEISQTSHKRTEHLKKTHPRNEWPANICLICYKIASTKIALSSHMITHSENRFTYTCDICGFKIVELKDFNLHMDRHQKKGEVVKQEEISDDFKLQSGSKGDNFEYKRKNLYKRKSVNKSSAAKNKKNCTV